MLNAGIEDEYENEDEEAAASEEMEIIYDNSVYTIDKHTGRQFFNLTLTNLI